MWSQIVTTSKRWITSLHNEELSKRDERAGEIAEAQRQKAQLPEVSTSVC